MAFITEQQAQIIELIGQLDNPDTAETAYNKLRETGQPAVPLLISALTYMLLPHVRATCARLLSEIGDKAAIPALQQLAEQDADTSVRQAAQTALTQF